MYDDFRLCYNLSIVKSDAVLNLRLPGPVKAALAKAADANMRTMSSMAAWAMSEWLTEHGFLDRDAGTQKKRGSKRSRR
jgi:hypothetical protein